MKLVTDGSEALPPAWKHRYIHKSVKMSDKCCVGTVAFKFERDPETGRRTRVEPTGGIYIHRQVELLAFSNVSAGITRATRLRRGVKIDSYVHVGHDAEIGEWTAVCAGAIIGGYAEIGSRCTIGLGAIILPRVKVGNDCYIGSGAVVTEDVPDNSVIASAARNGMVISPVRGRRLRTNFTERPWLKGDKK